MMKWLLRYWWNLNHDATRWRNFRRWLTQIQEEIYLESILSLYCNHQQFCNKSNFGSLLFSHYFVTETATLFDLRRHTAWQKRKNADNQVSSFTLFFQGKHSTTKFSKNTSQNLRVVRVWSNFSSRYVVPKCNPTWIVSLSIMNNTGSFALNIISNTVACITICIIS